MQPLIDEGLQRGVLRHPIGFFREVERLFRMDRAEHAGMLLLLEARLRRVGDHQIRLACRELVEDRQIVGIDDDLRGVEMRAVEPLVGPAGIGDDLDARPVDRLQRREFFRVRAPRDRRSCLRAGRASRRNPFFARSSVTETPPIAMSNAPASKSRARFGQLVGSNSTFTPSASASEWARSMSKPE